MRGIFVSYRREDGKADAGRICDHLITRFGEAEVFFDVDSIQPGADFVETLESRVSASDVLVAVIGPRWLAVTDASGHRRLDDPRDFVRIEIATALKSHIPVFPVL